MDFNKWVEDLKTNWINKDINKIMDMFDVSVKYFETPFQEVIGLENIRKMWHDIDSQDIKELTCDVLGIKDNTVIASYILILANGDIIDMVYQIELNENNKCVYFKQWYMHKK